MVFVALAVVGTLAFSAPAVAGGAKVAFSGGSSADRLQVTRALAASSFDWRLLPRRVAVHIGPGFASEAAPGEIWLDSRLLRSGRFAWGVVQHEFAHQIDFQLLTPASRARFASRLGAPAWCWSSPGFGHGDYGCERFASTVAWAYWPNAGNCMKPASWSDEAGRMTPAAFRAALAAELRVPTLRNIRRTP